MAKGSDSVTEYLVSALQMVLDAYLIGKYLPIEPTNMTARVAKALSVVRISV